jgi:hypothetical protein
MISKAEKAIHRAETAVLKVTVLERALGVSKAKERELDRKLQLVTKHKQEAGQLLIVSNLIWLIIVITILLML